MNLSLCNKSKIQDVFLLFENLFNIDQKDFGLVMGSDNCLR